MLELKDLSVGYGKKTVLKDLSFSLQKGEICAVIGPNGCGKSTLLKSIPALLPRLAGSVTVDGREIATLSRNDIAQRIAYLSQGKTTPDMTVSQIVLHGRFPYLSYPRHYREDDLRIASEAMARVGLLPLANAPLSSLSGGQRQIAYVAMALAQDTDYLLLDEPTTYLDLAHQRDVMLLLRSLADTGKGILTVLHDLPLAFTLCDRVAVMTDGKIAAVGNPNEISKHPLIRSLFGVSLMECNGAYYCEL